MNKREYFLFSILGIAVVLPAAFIQSTPGYMDADYYFAGGLRLAEGYGFSELFLWNYLDDPSGLPHPSHGYWMPIASILASLGMVLFQNNTYHVAKFGFLLVAGLIPPLTAALAFSINHDRKNAIFSGILAALPVFYLAYLSTTDTFAIYMVLGAVWFILAGIIEKAFITNDYSKKGLWLIFILGLTSGVMHLTRADGFLWLAFGIVFIVLLRYQAKSHINSLHNFFLAFISLFLGYALVMGPWMARNLNTFGTPLAPGGSSVLWLTDYNDLYTYPASTLTFQGWWNSGLAEILNTRIHALVQNVQTAIAVQGEILLVPLIVIGLWRTWDDVRIKIGLIAWIFTFFVMTVIFPEIGWRGGFFHSGAAFQPLFWSVVPVGLGVFIGWGQKLRGWDQNQARYFFKISIIVLLIVLTIFVGWRRVIGSNINNPKWGQAAKKYMLINRVLSEMGIAEEDVVLVNNAPGYFATNQRKAISIPNGDVQTTLLVAQEYDGRILILENDHPNGLDDLYDNPRNMPNLEYIQTVNDTHIFLIQ